MVQGLQPRSENVIEYLWVLEVGPVGTFHCLYSIVTVVLGKRSYHAPWSSAVAGTLRILSIRQRIPSLRQDPMMVHMSKVLQMDR
jgi:ABC-type tungstate transport system substrate-binding protein